MARIVKAPQAWTSEKKVSVFLAGSIEMGVAENWQNKLETLLVDWDGILVSPRRDDWDSSWEQTIDNPHFAEQVNWELDNLDKVDYVVFYFDPNTKSPITLLELGAMSVKRQFSTVVCCPKGFWRKGNVDIVCKRSNLKMVNSVEDLAAWIRNKKCLF